MVTASCVRAATLVGGWDCDVVYDACMRYAVMT